MRCLTEVPPPVHLGIFAGPHVMPKHMPRVPGSMDDGKVWVRFSGGMLMLTIARYIIAVGVTEDAHLLCRLWGSAIVHNSGRTEEQELEWFDRFASGMLSRNGLTRRDASKQRNQRRICQYPANGDRSRHGAVLLTIGWYTRKVASVAARRARRWRGEVIVVLRGSVA